MWHNLWHSASGKLRKGVGSISSLGSQLCAPTLDVRIRELAARKRMLQPYPLKRPAANSILSHLPSLTGCSEIGPEKGHPA